jgi:hypothetical protein
MNSKKQCALLEHFSVLPDPRKTDHNGIRHELIDVVIIAILAVICGADSWVEIAAFGREKEEWLKQFLELPNGIPSHDTFGRIFSLLDPDAFEHCFIAWTKTVCKRTRGHQTICSKLHAKPPAAGTRSEHRVAAGTRSRA